MAVSPRTTGLRSAFSESIAANGALLGLPAVDSVTSLTGAAGVDGGDGVAESDPDRLTFFASRLFRLSASSSSILR